MADTKNFSLTATYSSPTNEAFSLVRHIPAPPSDAVSDKVRYLETLRNAVDVTQALVNKELTARMDQDKAREASVGNAAAAKLGVDEDKEEDNYGEEGQDEE
ncbi:hypothetical protein XA68_17514 [Ophiocordyceps unilateralis]|uniref:EKC/KEOPS complex subunit GON7 n=1 Tax=Ophiocordyceps unilateralis TaxID=268505 RepID=A0A2A9P4R5_OPHUN|nr:hypothetical protein XA68_17514 [Ophiocordyceps unilateralis]